MKKTVLILFCLPLLLSACNTIEGMGRDVRNAGEGISDSATKVKEKINQ
jgi:predicted small secreted protein